MLIVGLGGIGTQIARRADAFGMRVMAVDPKESDRQAGVRLQPRRAEQDDGADCRKADVVVLACPLTEETQGHVRSEQFEAMKKSAYFINIARGGLVDQEALIDGAQEEAASPAPAWT